MNAGSLKLTVDFDIGRFPNDRDTHGINTVRMATVWMDDYIDLLYLNRPDLRVSSNCALNP